MLTTSFSCDLNLERVRCFHIYKPRIQSNCNGTTTYWKCKACMSGSSIALIDCVSRDRAFALWICEDTNGKGMLSSINIVSLGETCQGWWTTNCGWSWTAGCSLPINVSTLKIISTRINWLYLVSIVPIFCILWSNVDRCARLYTGAVHIYIYHRNCSITSPPCITRSCQWLLRGFPMEVIRPSTWISTWRSVTYISTCRRTIGWSIGRKRKCHRIDLRFHCRVLY